MSSQITTLINAIQQCIPQELFHKIRETLDITEAELEFSGAMTTMYNHLFEFSSQSYYCCVGEPSTQTERNYLSKLGKTGSKACEQELPSWMTRSTFSAPIH